MDRYDAGKLIAALRGAGLHFAGKTTQRMVATDIDVRETEAMMIIYVLEPALTVGRTHDPFFGHLFPDVHDQMDLPSLDEVDGTQQSQISTSKDVGYAGKIWSPTVSSTLSS